MNANNLQMKILSRKALNRETVKTTVFENFKRHLNLFSPEEMDYMVYAMLSLIGRHFEITTFL